MTKNQRLVVFLLLALVLGVLYLFPLTRPGIEEEGMSSVLFISLLLLSFTTLLLEHFFARPTDVLAAGVSILLLIIPTKGILDAWGVWY